MLLTFRYQLLLTKAQHARLEQILEAQRLLYNAALEERIDAWRKSKTSISKIDQFKSLTQIRSFDPSYGEVPVALSRWSIAKVDDAFTGFYSRIKRGGKAGFPRFRSKGRWQSFGFAEWDGVRLRGNRILFKPFKSGLRLKLRRPLPDGADLRSCTFTKTDRRWTVSLVVDVPAASAHRFEDRAVGIDVGTHHLATTSDGVHFENIKPAKRHERAVKLASRALARCRRGSKRRAKVKAHLARLKRRVANTRRTYLHEVSARIARDHGFIAVEALKVKNMTRSAKGTVEKPGKNVRAKSGLNRSMLDAATATLIGLISYKAERAGGIMVKVDAKNTSQDCSCCGERVQKDLSVRRHVCTCGADMDRDHNAAVNVLHRALQAHGRAWPPRDHNVGHRLERGLGNTVGKTA